jgi:hypothetical protein
MDNVQKTAITGEKHTAEPLVPEPSSFEVKVAIENLK